MYIYFKPPAVPPTSAEENVASPHSAEIIILDSPPKKGKTLDSSSDEDKISESSPHAITLSDSPTVGEVISSSFSAEKPLPMPSTTAVQPSASDDSFFNDDLYISPRLVTSNVQKSSNAPSTPVEKHMSSPHLTLSGKTRKIAARLGSGVKVIKVYDVTPMPAYETYTDDEIKVDFRFHFKNNGIFRKH